MKITLEEITQILETKKMKKTNIKGITYSNFKDCVLLQGDNTSISQFLLLSIIELNQGLRELDLMIDMKDKVYCLINKTWFSLIFEQDIENNSKVIKIS